MGETFTGKFILDTSDADLATAKTQSKVTQVEHQITTTRQKFSQFAEWAIHMSNIIAARVARNIEGTSAAQALQILQTSLAIMSAEKESIMAFQRGIAYAGTPGMQWASVQQFALSAALQWQVADMLLLKAEMAQTQAEQERSAAYWRMYG